MSDNEDIILERVLQRLENPELEDSGLDLDAEGREIWREYSELVGLLPYALDPVEPSPRVKSAILSAIRAERPSADNDNTVAFPTAASAPTTLRSVRLIAAALGALTLGMALLSGWMFRGNQIQETRIAELGRALEATVERSERGGTLQSELSGFRRVMTAPGMRICPLKPRGDTPVQPVARGAIYFDRQESNWLLTARDLEPCERGSVYKVWFIVEDGRAVPGADFLVEAGVPVTLGSSEMPADTKAVLLTLEEDPSVTQPTGPAILYGDESEVML